MATSSFFHNVVIDTPDKVKKFVRALETAKKKAEDQPENKYRKILQPEISENRNLGGCYHNGVADGLEKAIELLEKSE